jgi:hypothetical protein
MNAPSLRWLMLRCYFDTTPFRLPLPQDCRQSSQSANATNLAAEDAFAPAVELSIGQLPRACQVLADPLFFRSARVDPYQTSAWLFPLAFVHSVNLGIGPTSCVRNK